jgi:putative flippase GtrA
MDIPVAGTPVLMAKYSAVSLLGFAVDALALYLALQAGLQPAWARVISLACAMHVTFFINRRHVFKCLDHRRMGGQWAGYMATNGFGNLCNYLIFVTLVSTHWRIVSSPAVAMPAGAFCAWVINFAGTRYLVFGGAPARLAARFARWRSPRAVSPPIPPGGP